MNKRNILIVSAMIGLAIVLALVVKSYAQSSNVVSPTVSTDCSSVTLTDAAGTEMGPYTKKETQNKYNQAVIMRKNLLERIAQEDAQIAASSIALQAFNSCVVPMNISADTLVSQISAGQNWESIKGIDAGVNWQSFSQANGLSGINWSTLNTSGINWVNWPLSESQGQNLGQFITSNGQ